MEVPVSGETPLKMRTFEKFDGSTWRQYESPDALILLTGVGRRLMAAGNIGRLLHLYADDYANWEDPEKAKRTRRFLAAGGHAQVYSVGNSPFAVKERIPEPDKDQLFAAINRMDQLIYAVDKHCPGWIGVPQHYGIIMLKRDIDRQYMLMQKIDEGVTVGDVLGRQNAHRPTAMKYVAEHLFHPITPDLKEEIAGRYGILRGEVTKALVAEHLSPDEFLPDIDRNPHNIVLERLPEPVDGSDIKFWIIDQ